MCDNRKAGNPSATLPSPPDSTQSMSSGGGDGATSARINPALRRIFFIPVLSRPRLALILAPVSPFVPSKPISYLALSLSFSLLCFFLFHLRPPSHQNSAENALRGKVAPSRQLHSRRSSFSLLDSNGGERMNSTGFKRLDFEFDNTFAGLYISFDKKLSFYSKKCVIYQR